MNEGAVLSWSVVATILPTLLYAGLIYWVDRYEKEPWWLLASAFLWGAIPSIALALLFNSLFSNTLYGSLDSTTAESLTGIFIAPLVEESVKGLAVLAIFVLWRTEIDSPLDGIIYGAMVGMGFAMVENLYYFVTIFAEQGAEAWGTSILLRAIVFGLNHALFTSMTGLGIAVARLATGPALKIVAPILGWSTAVFLHTIHNLTVSFDNGLCFLALLSDWGGIFLTVGIIIWSLVQEKSWIKAHLAEEVKLGTLTALQYERSLSRLATSQARLRQLRQSGWGRYRASGSFYRRCSELAYKKHHFVLFGDEKSAKLVRQLRAEIRSQSGSIGC
jgi:RsiW-degrading membrane proteinase PrsW (M82 family)